MSKIAWIGLGVMGYPLAGHHKMRGHHDVVVFNRTRKRADAWVATFGGTAASSVTFNSSTQLTATAPARAAGTVGVTVTNPGGQSATKASAFTYSATVTPAISVQSGM